MDTEKKGLSGAILVEKSVTIMKPAEEIFRFWRKLENLPRIMSHLLSVEVKDPKRSHWVSRGPVNSHVEWDAEITSEIENRQINWRSAGQSDIDASGSVFFSEAPGNRGTEVKVFLFYKPPGGVAGAAFAGLFGEAPSQQIAEDLRQFKQIMEAGEKATIEGQPKGG